MTTASERQESIGREVFRLHQLSAEAELLYELSLGEATAETTALEDWIAGSTDDTLHALLQFHAELEGRAAAIATEAERLAEVKRRNTARQEWVKARTIEVARRPRRRRVRDLRPPQERTRTTMRTSPNAPMIRLSDPRSCHVVGTACKAPPALGDATRAECYACGNPVCVGPSCSRRILWYGARRRVCTSCAEESRRMAS